MDSLILYLTDGTTATLAQAAMPQVDAQYVVLVLSRVLHLLSAMVLVGGLFYMRMVLAPAGSDACFAGRRVVWARWVGVASFFVLISGIYNLIITIRAAKLHDMPLPAIYHVLFGIKVLLALMLLFIMASLSGETKMAERFRGQMLRWLNIAWLTALCLVIIAAVLRTFH